MTNPSNNDLKAWFPRTRYLLAILFLSVAVAGMIWWIYVAETMDGSQAMKVERFLQPFPAYLQDARQLTWIQIGFSGVAFLIFYLEKELETVPKALNKGLLYFSGFISFWLLFSLM